VGFLSSVQGVAVEGEPANLAIPAVGRCDFEECRGVGVLEVQVSFEMSFNLLSELKPFEGLVLGKVLLSCL
jgi:hypothetical protein